MAKKNLSKIFLSASIPSPERDRRYFDTADIVSIRDAVRALATVVIPKAHLVWGGHPSITPVIRYVMERMKADLKTHITLYQSKYFKEYSSPDNFAFENIVLTDIRDTRSESLKLMRDKLIGDNDFEAGIFVGGMEGVYQEYEMFKEKHPNALILPIASTGAAARMVFQNQGNPQDMRLLNDYAYMSLFRDFLNNIINN